MNFLKVLVDPPEAEFDIVAVHGLNPTNKEDHAQATWTASNNKMWLKDFLPSQLPTARILLFGYNANVAFETSIAGVTEYAENLLNRLRGKRRVPGTAMTRPIIFVCHSLGGIITKKALTIAKLDSTYETIGKACYGIAFFATPHQGGNFASLGSIAASIARVTLMNPKNSFMEALKTDSLFADNIISDFRHQLEDFHVLSFYETLSLKRLSLVVDKKSATLGLAGSRERQIAVEADHNTICKFGAEDDPAYELVLDNILELAEGAMEIGRQRESGRT